MKATLSKFWILPLVVVVLLSGCMGKKLKYHSLLQKEENDKPILIQNINVFDGVDTILKTGMDVIIEDGKIKYIEKTGHAGALLSPGSAFFIEGSGKTLVPGFTDAHVHLTATGAVPWQKSAPNIGHNLEAYLASGITTVYDLGGVSGTIDKWQMKVDSGKIPGPDIFNTDSPVTAPGSHPIPSIQQLLPKAIANLIVKLILQADNPSQAKEIIQKLKDKNVDFVKLICDQIPPGSPEMSEEVMNALIKETHAQGYKVFAHIGTPLEAVNAANSGADIIAHIPYRGKLSEADAKKIKDSGAAIIYTLAGFEGVAAMCNGTFQPSDMEKRMSHPEVTGPATGSEGKKFLETPVLGDFGKEISAHQSDWKPNIELLKKAGVPFLIGTDSPIPGAYEGGAFHREMQSLHKAGLSNGNIMLAATSSPGKILFENPTFGVIAPGMKANVVILNGDPMKIISHTEKIEVVIKSGVMYKPTK